MRKRIGALFAVVTAAMAITHAQSSPTVPAIESRAAGLWFVELASPPLADGTAAAALEQEESRFHAAAAGAGIAYSEGRHFRSLWNGLTVRTAARNVAALRTLPGVQGVYPVSKVTVKQIDTAPPPAAEMVTALAMTGADVAQSELGLTGQGIKVAVIDSGIDYDHPDLGQCFGPECRVAKGYDFVGDTYNVDDESPVFQPTPHPDPFPDDCNGHGTHVSGIIGANGGITGVAPGVTFHGYRVFGCAGNGTDDIILAAMEMALADGSNVVNLSLGGGFDWPQSPLARGANRLVRHGVVVVASIGNDGELGLYSAGSPGLGKEVIGVASFDNTHANLVSFTIAPGNASIGYVVSSGAPAPPTTGAFAMSRTGTAASVDDACAALPAGSLTSTVVLIRRGTCGFSVKAANAQAAGASGVVLYNNAAGIISPTVAGTVPITIPVVAISDIKGALIDRQLAAGPVTMTWTALVTSELQPTGGLISSFSSYGPGADLSVKPDIGAPGGSVRSTLPLEQGGYGTLSGTSMASPHVAGAVALMLEARPGLPPDQVLERLQNTARPHPWFGNPLLGDLDNVHRQGAGLLEIDDAIVADAGVSPSKLALGEIESGVVRKVIHLSRASRFAGGNRPEPRHGSGADGVTYRLGHEPALATGANEFTPVFLSDAAAVRFSTPFVTIGGSHDDTAAIVVTFKPPANANARLFGGYITLIPDDGSTVLRVPYMGYNGDYQAIAALTPTPAGLPWLAAIVDGNVVNQPAGAAFTLQGDDVPVIVYHLDHHVRRLKMEVIDVTTGQSLGFADNEPYLPRNTTPTSAFLVGWDGTTTKNPGSPSRAVPNGTYRIELSVLKALGDPDNPAHAEHWTSPNIVVTR